VTATGGDLITLTIPADEGFDWIAYLVLGGLAVRLDVTFEHLEDLNLALEGLLEERADDGEVTVAVRVLGDELQTSVGPFAPGHLRAELEREPREGVGLKRVLSTVMDTFDVADRDGGEWIEMRKTVQRVRRNG
jgi:hypothetical protein